MRYVELTTSVRWPVAMIFVAGSNPAVLAADGKAVYETVCIACHATGVGNAPRLGDKAAWAPRLTAGRDGLVKSVIAGKGAMPPRAGNAKLRDGDIRAAVDHMLASVK